MLLEGKKFYFYIVFYTLTSIFSAVSHKQPIGFNIEIEGKSVFQLKEVVSKALMTAYPVENYFRLRLKMR